MKTILVVDDNPANIGLLFDCLNHEGYKTLVAQDGKSAVSMAFRLLPDLILLDVIMPEMDGFDTCCALKEQPETAGIPVFFMTALADIDSKVRGFKCGAVDFICKPFQQEEVLARINTHLTIQDQKKSLILANRIKEKVVSVVAHDLRSPFTAIFAYLQMLDERYDQYDDAKRKSLIQKLRGVNNALYELVESLMTWITTGEGEMEFNPGSVCLRDIVTTACEVTKSLAVKKSIELDLNVAEDLFVYADANMLAAVVRNLLTNALKFTPRSGRVSVGAQIEDSCVILSVTDTGVGMEPPQVDLLLAGTKLPSTPGTEDEAGTGMGLIICLEFIKMMKGCMTIESHPGKGSTFMITLDASPH